MFSTRGYFGITVFESQGFVLVSSSFSVNPNCIYFLEMGNIWAPLKSNLLCLWWLRTWCLAFLKFFLNIDRKHIAWDKGTEQIHWNEWFYWYILYKEEVVHHQEEVLHQRLECQAAMNNFWQGQFYLKALFDWHFMPQCLRKYIQEF